MKIKVLCNVIHVGQVYGKKDEIIELPDEIAKGFIKAKRAEEVKEKSK